MGQKFFAILLVSIMLSGCLGQDDNDIEFNGIEYQYILLMSAILSFAAAACIWVMRNNLREDSNNIAKEEYVE